MTRPVLVLGAGMVGTCTALHLALRGHPVTLVDRREPGRETSYGNAGVIQREAVEPYPFPRDLPTLTKFALRRGAAVNYHPGALPALAGRLLRYWRLSHPRRYVPIAAAYAALIAHATTEHAPLIDRAGAHDLVRRQGYRFVFRSAATWQRGIERAQAFERVYGLRHTVLDARQMAAAEPALRAPVAGGLHWLDPWTVTDPGGLVARYADAFTAHGGRILRGDAGTLRQRAAGWEVTTEEGVVDAPEAVIALGPWSASLLGTLGYRFPLFVKRGYHRHYHGDPPPVMTLYDVDSGLVICPMRAGVRVTTGVEFAPLDARPTPVQMARAEALARGIVTLGDPVEDQPWMGGRPCSADMLPLIGRAPRHAGLWLNLGHAHQGFTLGPVSGRLLAEQITGDAPLLDPAPYAPARFG